MAHLLLELFLSKHCELVPIDLLGVEHLLVVHLFDKGVILDTVGLEKLHVGNLEGLADTLGYKLGLQTSTMR